MSATAGRGFVRAGAADRSNVRARRRQRQSHALTDAGLGTGHQSNLAVEIKRRRDHRGYFSWQMSRTFMSV
jgi:hypothetical protein